jgi:hypothetical protein
MNQIVEWLNANKLSINPSKTKFIIFKSKYKSLNQEITLKEKNIKQAFYVKFLGVVIDHDFTWKNHVSSVLKNIIKSAGLIAKLRLLLTKTV